MKIENIITELQKENPAFNEKTLDLLTEYFKTKFNIIERQNFTELSPEDQLRVLQDLKSIQDGSGYYVQVTEQGSKIVFR